MTTGRFTNSTEFVNTVLVRIGEDTISNIDGDKNKEILVGKMYYLIRRSCLSRRQWRFAMVKKKLSALSASPVNEFEKAYQLPADLLVGPTAAFDSDSTGVRPFHAWELYGNEILTDCDELVIDYLADIENVLRWPGYFAELVNLALCAALAAELTDSETLVTEFHQRAWGTPQENYSGGWYRIAAKMDRGTSVPTSWKTSHLIDARRGGR